VIIRSVRATNFQRYRKLELTNLPERGIIGITGENESGKSTIGEALSFAFFGRTLQRSPEELKDIITWGEETASVSVDFWVNPANELTVTREVDRDGSYYCELTDRQKGGLVARGVGKVQRQLDTLIPFDFDDFRHSFHLGQKEFDLLFQRGLESRRELLDRMTGVQELDAAAAKVQIELEGLRRDQTRTERELALTERLRQEYSGLGEGIGPGHARLEWVGERVSQLEQQLTAIDDERLHLEARDGGARVALASLEAIRLRSLVHALEGATEHLRAGSAERAAAVTEIEEEVQQLKARTQGHREFRAKLDELEGLVKLKAEELNLELKNNLEGYSTHQREMLTPDSKLEQLVFTEKRMGQVDVQLVATERARLWALAGLALLLVGMGGTGLTMLLGKIKAPGSEAGAVFSLLFLAGIGGCWFRITTARQTLLQLGETRRSLEMHRSILQEDVGRIRRALEACLSFVPAELAKFGDRVRQVESPRIQELYDRIAKRHPEFMEPEAALRSFSEEMESRLREKKGALAVLSRQHQEMEEFNTWLSATLSGLRRSSAYPERAAGLAGEAWNHEAFRLEKDALVSAAQEAGRRLYGLESLRHAEVLTRPLEVLRETLPVVLPAGTVAPEPAWFAELGRLAAGETGESLAAVLNSGQLAMDRLLALVPPTGDLRHAATEASARRDVVVRELEEARLEKELISAELARAEPDARREQELVSTQAQLKTQLEATVRAVRVRETLLGLLGDVSGAVRARFGPAMAEFLGWILPQVTVGRYSQVRVSPDLEIEVFSAEKQAFVGLESLSGGTVDQLLLALRLAISKALVHSQKAADYRQYLFFDEPFASFDEQRAEAFLRFFRKEDPNFAQVFLVSHLPGLVTHCDAMVKTSIAQGELVLGS
jgi:DNA repair exonuclease SbcCD ATPase subunit